MASDIRVEPGPLLARARELAADGRRRMLGITGPPGSGKSTLAGALAGALGPSAVVVGMDGFHLAQAELERLDLAWRKGAPDTFDRVGFAALLGRLRAGGEPVVHAPLFRRDLEEAIAGAVPVRADVPLVIVEGNYLLLWPEVRAQFDETWYLDVPREVRHRRLIERRMAHGADEAEARRWTLGSDEDNALVIERTRELADLVVG